MLLKNLLLSLVATLAFAQGAFAKFNPDVKAFDCKDGRCGPWYSDTDGGDNPWSPGCIAESAANDCSNGVVSMAKDTCSGDTLFEVFTDAACQESSTPNQSEWSCNGLCMKEYGVAGTCVAANVPICGLVGHCQCENDF